MSKITDKVNEIIVKTNANTNGTNIHNATSKATPVDADELAILDSENSFSLKKLTWANLKNVLFGSPALTGTPTAPTATAGTNTTQIATTAFAQPRLNSGINIKTINNNSLLGSGDIPITPTTAQVATITAGLSAGGIGTYMFAQALNIDVPYPFGATIAGSLLKPAGIISNGVGVINFSGLGSAQSGTWRAMGHVTTIDYLRITLWLRIA